MSPGLFQEINAEPGKTYRVLFSIKSEEAEFLVTIGGISAFEGHTETLVRSSETIPEWRRFEYEYTMPPEYDRMRFELSVLRAGTLWVDDVEISGVEVGTEGE